jgi:hypothetical protein
MLDHAKERGDFVGYAAALLQSVTYANKSPKVVSQPA